MHGLIVIGDDLSSYIAAAAASGKGIKTALLSENGIGDFSVIGDLAFNTDSTPLTGFGEHQMCSSILKNMGISLESHVLNPAYQVILPEHRIDFFNNKEDLVKELSREFPDLTAGIKSFYDMAEKNSAIAEKWLQDHSFIQPGNFKEYMDYIKLTPHLINNMFNNKKMRRLATLNASFKKVVEAQQILLSFLTDGKKTFFSNLEICASLRGVHHFAQGRHSLYDALIKKIEAAQGSHITQIEVLAIKKGKVFEVTYMDKSGVASMIEADHLIVSTKWQNMRLIIDRKKKLSFGDFIRPTKISHYPFTLHLGITPQCIPEKMARHVAVISDVKKDIHDDNVIILEWAASDNDQAVASKIPLSATVFLPAHDDIWSRDNLKVTADSIIERLEYFLPFLKENIQFIDIDASITVSQKQRDVVNPKYRLRHSFITGFAAKNNKTRFKHIYLTGASLLADAGMDGEVLSGINAVSRITDKNK